ncbi:PREDICTED: threonine-rich protein-like isoform X3 [Acropora digitifera]|uniref:threonine-rich protein-like isoform X2 n=1 Tax=Acropora digitifera TaxID=70779 RepID=UPI00077A0271|nr:PREDICTED: threonine-rich protein-like isoform X2 [Acropora digitifera]XP_015776267.1 PREDICTED: threonine-rich protein-like isoform X3 [Acropora digitifera]
MKVLLLSLMIFFAYIVLTELAPHIGAVQRDSHMENLTCAKCQGVTEINCTLGERGVQCNPGEVCTTLEAFNLDTGTTTVTRGCFNITGLNCDDNPGCGALNTTGNIQSCGQFCCNTSFCNAGTLNTVTPQITDGETTTKAPTTKEAPPETKAPTTTETRIPFSIARTTFPCKYLAVVTILAIETIFIPF